MEISDDAISKLRAEDPLEREAREVFRDTLGLIHIALVTHYRMLDSEAQELEKDLYLWFVRFCMRPGSKSPKDSRSFLLVACCQFAREYQKYVIGTGLREADSTTEKILAREPSEVAGDFAHSLDLLKFRHHPDA